MFEWDDLRYFLAVARHGSTLAAGRALNISQSTVQRRLVELERKLGRDLVKRYASGYRLTEFGEQMLPYAEGVERAIATFEQQKSTIERAEVGVIRLTCPEPIMYRITQSGLLDRFHARYPDLRVEFVMSDKYLDIAKGDADVAYAAKRPAGFPNRGRRPLNGASAHPGYAQMPQKFGSCVTATLIDPSASATMRSVLES